ncbi:MAG TPA: flagellar assembly protein FliW [Symbiobacteriaceae bacterium]|jgi:ComF family protein
MLRLIVRGLLDVLWPPRTRCLLCEGALTREGTPAGTSPGVPVCSGCLDAMGFRPGVNQCESCSRPTTGGGALCADCAAGSPYGRVFALGFHEGALREAIHHLKFGGRSDLAVPLGRKLAPLVVLRPDLVMAVPLHRSRLHERGYNQAALLAEGLAGALAVPVTGGLLRLRATGHQAKLDRAGRLHNLDGAFGTTGRPSWVDRSVLLVDDVLTTGATAAAVARVLRGAGARDVNLAVLAVSATPVRGLYLDQKLAGRSRQNCERWRTSLVNAVCGGNVSMSEPTDQIEQSIEAKAFDFSAPIFGFPDVKRYVVLEVPGGGDIFRKLAALDQNLQFTLVFPFAFFPDYAPDIPQEDLKEIGVTNPEQAIVMCIATVPERFKDATVNLRAPLVFNPFTRTARQVILPDDRYPTRARLLKA